MAAPSADRPVANGQVRERSLSELVGDMTQDVSTLLRKEVELAREELKVEVSKAARAGGGFGAAAYAGILAGVGLVMTLGFLLDEVMPTWVAFLIVTVLLVAVATAAFLAGKKQLETVDPVPEQTIQTLKEDKQWLSEQRN
ncbi:MAG: phage holin family protein [Acidimicrobiales bacterium]|nr:phage holin family protein [Acidimicrobiales bacterium]